MLRRTGRMLDWGSGGNEYNTNHSGMDSLDCEYGRPDSLEKYNIHYQQVANKETPLPVPDGFYHLIRSNHSIGHIQSEAEDFIEMKRILSPGGTIIIKGSSNYTCQKEKKDYIRVIDSIINAGFPWPLYHTEVFWRDIRKEGDIRFVATIEYRKK